MLHRLNVFTLLIFVRRVSCRKIVIDVSCINYPYFLLPIYPNKYYRENEVNASTIANVLECESASYTNTLPIAIFIKIYIHTKHIEHKNIHLCWLINPFPIAVIANIFSNLQSQYQHYLWEFKNVHILHFRQYFFFVRFSNKK